MAGRLASQIMGGNGVVSRSVASSLRLRSGMGLPVGKHIVPDKPVSFHLIRTSINFNSMLIYILFIVILFNLVLVQKTKP